MLQGFGNPLAGKSIKTPKEHHVKLVLAGVRKHPLEFLAVMKIRQLTESEKLYVIRLCHLGRIDDAVSNYLLFRCGALDFDPVDRPEYVQVSNDCVWLVFENSVPTFTESAREYMQQYLANRPVLNLQLLRAAFSSYELERAKADRFSLSPKPADTAPEEIDIESLSDAEIEQLKEASMLEYARQRQRR